ncbi:hypothetical protein Bca52824_063348 [Brassica carinata]|uniref:Uncharacterized protein n=1 Tax=Brassica carinata TaxID=52824 RepID=A0A8X7QFE4_BRACI|nr:hypothetical protein Bca52824_063348 [Brassica carinata]
MHRSTSDEDVAFDGSTEIEERYKRNSQYGGMVRGVKGPRQKQRNSCRRSGANSENCEQEKGNVCGDDLAVDNRENKEVKVKEGGAENGARESASTNLSHRRSEALSVEQVSVENGNNGGAPRRCCCRR